MTRTIEIKPRTKTHVRILEAVERGYAIDEDGNLFGPKGPIIYKLSGTQRYATFSTNWGGVFGVPVHMFAAYKFFGTACFEKGVNIRHMDRNTLNNSKSNLKLGSSSENQLDKPVEVRSYAAKCARASQPTRAANSKLTRDSYSALLKLYNSFSQSKLPNGKLQEIASEFQISRVSVLHAVNGRTYKDWYEEEMSNA